MNIKSKADSGDAKACYQYGYYLQHEKNNPHEATVYYQKGIEAGRKPNANCLFALGEAYWDGDGVPQDHEKAEQLFSMAVPLLVKIAKKKKDPFAQASSQFFLGVIYLKSNKLRDDQKAYNYFVASYKNSCSDTAKSMAELIEKCSPAGIKTKKIKYKERAQSSATLDVVFRFALRATPENISSAITAIEKTVNFASLLFGGSGISSSLGARSTPSEYPYNAPKTVGRGRMVLDGVHYYFEKSNGERIAIEQYDRATGEAKGYDGKTYNVDGGGLDYK
ncbi:MAG: hypothetical protein FWD49_00115 [Firmicutes bacterium]|nr:hypothetical protein [Bacillota bacterium]